MGKNEDYSSNFSGTFQQVAPKGSYVGSPPRSFVITRTAFRAALFGTFLLPGTLSWRHVAAEAVSAVLEKQQGALDMT